MDKHLRPSRLVAEANTTSSEREWKHWLRTFSNFIASMEKNKDFDGNRLDTLINYVSPSIYEHIADAVSYDNAIQILEKLYVKPRNEIYNRHLLASRRQEEGETLDQFIQELTKLSKECTFTTVTATQYCDEYIRDAFINGLNSRDIRQRLLENVELSKEDAFRQARALEMAQKHSSQYHNPISAALQPPNDDSLTNAGVSQPNDTSLDKKCFFCGLSRHHRSKCPARDSVCNHCSKTGHWERVCKAKSNTKGKVTSAALPKLMAIQTGDITQKRCYICYYVCENSTCFNYGRLLQ